MRSIVIVLDGFGAGELPDAEKYGDIGTNTCLHIIEQCNPYLPNLEQMGLYDIVGLKKDSRAIYGKAMELSAGKDTPIGHFELMGLITGEAYMTFPNGFPPDLIDFFKDVFQCDILGGIVSSGTEIIKQYGDEHLLTKKPIIYTSADSVIQVACHVDAYTVDELYYYCKMIRTNLPRKYNAGRIIARPFAGKPGNYYRTEDRKDFTVPPASDTLLDLLYNEGKDVIAVGKIDNIFSMRGITKHIHTNSNDDGIQNIIELLKSQFDGLLFANLVDFDMVYGHRNNVNGYAKALEKFDEALPEIFSLMGDQDMLIITADHGCDPTTKGTDHTREYVPVLMRTASIKHKQLGVIMMSDIAATIAKHQNIEYNLSGTAVF